MASHVKATVRRGHKGKGRPRRIEIEPADKGKGFIARTHYPQPTGKKSFAMPYVEPETSVHPDLDSVHDHLDKHMGGGPEEAGEVPDTDEDGE